MPQARTFVLKLVVDESGQFQVQGSGLLTPAEVIAGLRMYEWQVLSQILQGARPQAIPGLNPRKVGS